MKEFLKNTIVGGAVFLFASCPRCIHFVSCIAADKGRS